jgi:hypothetical protein
MSFGMSTQYLRPSVAVAWLFRKLGEGFGSESAETLPSSS